MNYLNMHILFIRKTTCKTHTMFCYQHAKNECLSNIILTYRESINKIDAHLITIICTIELPLSGHP